MSNFITLTFDNTQPLSGDTYTLTQEDTLGVSEDVIWTVTQDLLIAQQPFKVLDFNAPTNQNVVNATNF